MNPAIGSRNFAPQFGDSIKPQAVQFGKANSIVSKESTDTVELSPKAIKAKLDKHVIGQEAAKTNFALALYEHCLRFMDGQPKIEKSAAIRMQESPEIHAEDVDKAFKTFFTCDSENTDVYEYEILPDLVGILQGNLHQESNINKLSEKLVPDILDMMDDGIVDTQNPDQGPLEATRAFLKLLQVTAVKRHEKTIAQAETSKSRVDFTEVESDELADVEVQKDNVMMLGPSGSGKTELLRAGIKALEELDMPVPFIRFNAADITEAGYVGSNPEDALRELFIKSGKDLGKAEFGIIALDEIDKKRAGSDFQGRDVAGKGAQSALLTLLEDNDVEVPVGPHQSVNINTKNIMFILNGAFVGLEDIIAQRIGVNQKAGTGFTADVDPQKVGTNDLLEQTEAEDLIAYGMMPELVGRAPIIAPLNQLSESDVVHILTEPQNALIKQYQKKLKQQGIDLQFEPAAIAKLGAAGKNNPIGARALRGLMHKVTKDIRFNQEQYKGKTVTITKKMVDAALAKETSQK